MKGADSATVPDEVYDDNKSQGYDDRENTFEVPFGSRYHQGA